MEGRHYGLVILVREGLAAWARAALEGMPRQAASTSVAADGEQALDVQVMRRSRAEIVAVIANMVMAIEQEQCA